MGLYNNFPYTNFHEMNLDWILQELKNLVEEWDKFGANVTATAHESADPEVIVSGNMKDTLSFDFGLVRGPRGYTGQTGQDGPPGPPGTGLEILDEYATLADLQTAHPTGSAGDAYLVGTGGSFTLYIWSTDAGAWVDAGSLTSPSPSTIAPVMDGTAAVGTSLLYARADHAHPSDTYKLDKSNTDGIYAVVSGSQTMIQSADTSTADTLVRYDAVGDINTKDLNASGDVNVSGDLTVVNDIDAQSDVDVAGDLAVTGDISGNTITITSNDILNSDKLEDIAQSSTISPFAYDGVNSMLSMAADGGDGTPVISLKGDIFNDDGTHSAVTETVGFQSPFKVTSNKIDLKPATALQLGGVKIGSGINVDVDGVISANAGSETPFTLSGTVSITATTSTAGAPQYSGVDLAYKMTADGREFMIYGSLLAKGSTVNNLCTLTTSLQVDAPATTIEIKGLPIVGLQPGSAAAGHFLSIDTSGYVKLNIYAPTNQCLLTIPPIRIKLDEWA